MRLAPSPYYQSSMVSHNPSLYTLHTLECSPPSSSTNPTINTDLPNSKKRGLKPSRKPKADEQAASAAKAEPSPSPASATNEDDGLLVAAAETGVKKLRFGSGGKWKGSKGGQQ